MRFFKKLRFLIRLFIAFFKKRSKGILIGLILGIIFYIILPKLVKFLPRFRKIEKIGIVGKFSISEIPPNILDKISIGLTSVLPNGNVVPELCDRFEVSPDGKVYTFYFTEKKFFWHDGKKFAPEDINYNFKDAKLLPIDSQTLKIILKEPFSPFPTIVSQPLFKRGLIGLGKYKVRKIERSGQMLKSILLVPDKKTDSSILYYKFYLNDSQLRLGFKLGEINKIEELDQLKEFESWNNLSISRSQSKNRQVILFFNTQKDPLLDKNFRQAISYSITKKESKERAISPISSLSWTYNPGVKKYEKDIAKAKLLLSKVKIQPNLKFSLYTLPSLENEAIKIKEEMELLGLNIEIKISSIIPNDFDFFLAVREIPSDPDQYQFWHTGQRFNISSFSNPRIDKLLEDGRKTLNQDERKKIYFDFQRFLVEESPAIFLYYPSYNSIERN